MENTRGYYDNFGKYGAESVSDYRRTSFTRAALLPFRPLQQRGRPLAYYILRITSRKNCRD